ncbi:MAG: helix-turn-helix domain-containing protein [Limisphaerales bacterium]
MRSSRHRFPELLYFREGEGHIRFDLPKRSEQLNCEPGDCVIVPANVDHAIVDEPGTPLSLYGLALDPKKIAVGSELGELLPTGKIPRQRIVLLDIEKRLRRLLYLAANPSPVAKLSAVASAIELFATIAQPHAGKNASSDADDEIHEYLDWLSRNFFEAVTLDAGAIACGFSRRKFTELFKQQTGKSWLNYLHELRVNHAVALLCETDSQVTSIAFQCGFDDLSTFYRVFKRLNGRQPLEVRTSSQQ